MKIIFFLTKGRNLKESLIYLKKKKIRLNNKKDKKTRKLFFKSNKKNLYFFIIKNKDFKNYIEKNIIDFLIIGEDLILNKKINNFYNYKILKINLFFISIISNKDYKNKKNIIIYTKYKNIAKNYLNSKNIKNYKINYLEGSIENLCVLKKTDIILDIVSTGKTIKENKIFEIKKIMFFNNILLFNKNIIYNKIFKFMEKKYVKK